MLYEACTDVLIVNMWLVVTGIFGSLKPNVNALSKSESSQKSAGIGQ